MASIQMISADLFKSADLHNSVVLDVRTSAEHAEKRLVCGHIHVPLDELQPRLIMSQQGKTVDTPVYILCRSGGRARQAAEKFIAEGYQSVFVVEGGLAACIAGQHAVTGDLGAKSIMSMERQVRVLAGAIIVLGAMMALTINPIFTVIPLLVGCGLVYSGTADWCGMAMLLAKAPWNQIAAEKTACCTPKKL